jgi:hypothetical protein
MFNTISISFSCRKNYFCINIILIIIFHVQLFNVEYFVFEKNKIQRYNKFFYNKINNNNNTGSWWAEKVAKKVAF